jgi:DNA adenine methylase
MPHAFGRLIEPFAGSAAITLACASENRAKQFLINDINKPLIDLLKLVVEDPEYASKKYKEIWTGQEYDSIEHYYQISEKFNHTKDPIYFLYLLARCSKGTVRYDSEGLFNQNPDKRRKGTRPSQMEKNIYDISSLLKGKIAYYSLDYKDIFNMALPGDIIYIDPPCQSVHGEKDSGYFSDIEREEFIEELKKLINRRISFLVSYDGNEIPIKAGIKHVKLNTGRSGQSTLSEKNEMTYESLYISNDLYRKKNISHKGWKENELFT